MSIFGFPPFQNFLFVLQPRVTGLKFRWSRCFMAFLDCGETSARLEWVLGGDVSPSHMIQLLLKSIRTPYLKKLTNMSCIHVGGCFVLFQGQNDVNCISDKAGWLIVTRSRYVRPLIPWLGVSCLFWNSERWAVLFFFFFVFCGMIIVVWGYQASGSNLFCFSGIESLWYMYCTCT